MSHNSETEDAELRDAMRQSALEFYKQDQHQNKAISPEMESVVLYQSIDLAILSAADADTLVYLGTPPQQADQDDKAYARIRNHYAKFRKIHSENVLSSGSAKLELLLGPTSQFRTERRLRNEGVLPGGKPDDIKYLLDLRPPSEGEDAIFLLTRLSCSAGILTWFKAQKKYDIPKTMVCGQDDASSLSTHLNHAARTRKQSEPWKKTKKPVFVQKSQGQSSVSRPAANDDSSRDTDLKRSRVGNWEGVFPASPAVANDLSDEGDEGHAAADDGSAKETSKVSLDETAGGMAAEEVDVQPEYSQLRHWSAIERLLHAIEGRDPMLDSAPKLWTFSAVASYFGCATNERVSRWITKWLFTAPNNNFIQCNPEVCYNIGLGIQSVNLLRDAFSVLVGEKALIDIRRDYSDAETLDLTVSVAGRKLELLDEDELGRIAHAANVFTKRIQAKFAALVDQDMQWLRRSAIFQVLDGFVAHSDEEGAVAWQLIKDIKTFVRTRVLWVLARNYYGDGVQKKERFPEAARLFYPHASAHFSIYNTLNQEEQVFTRLFWTALKVENFDWGANGVYTQPVLASDGDDLDGWMAPSPIGGWSPLAQKLKDSKAEHHLVMLHRGKLLEVGAKFMNILFARYWGRTLQGIYPPVGWATVQHLASQADPRMPNREDAISDDVSKGKAVSQSSLLELETLQLSSPKRTPGTGAVTDLGHEKRARLDLDNMHGSSDQENRIQTDLPFRAAPNQSENTAESSKGAEAKVSMQQFMKTSENFAARFAYRETKVPTANQSEASGSASGTARPRFSGLVPVITMGKKHNKHGQLDPGHDFPVSRLLGEITEAAQGICDEVMLAPHFYQDGEVPPTDLIDTLMCLDDHEWKYLPLWAGGNDDGTGGVYNDLELPILETGGFTGGKRGLGEKQGSSVAGSSDWSEILTSVGRASKEAIDGTATETATVQSLSDVDMDVESLDDDDSVVRDDGTVVDLAVNSVDNYGGEDEDEKESDNEQGDGDSDMEMEDNDTDDVEVAEWDDCLD
jgi:hypothetical protein